MAPLEESIASILLRIGAVSLRPSVPYTWASGLRSPIYCDNRLLLGYPPERRTVIRGFATLLDEHGLTPDLIAGTATAGIPHAAWLAHEKDLPMVYVRPEAKKHGQGNRIEGPVRAGQSVILLEDLISTGASSRGAAATLQQAGLYVQAVLAIFSYGFEEARKAFASIQTPYHTLTTFDTLLRVAIRQGRLKHQELKTLETWRADPVAWSDTHQT